MLGQNKKNFLTESEVWPKDLISRQKDKLAADIKKLLQFQADFVSVSCPTCGLFEAQEAFIKDGFHYRVCFHCHTMYISPRPTMRIMMDYYKFSRKYKFWTENIFPLTDEIRREKIYLPIVNKLIDIFKGENTNQKGVLLEIGAGTGVFAKEITKTGLFNKVILIEPIPAYAEICRQKQLEVIEAPIEDVTLESSTIDIVVSLGSIEYLFNPREFLIKCASLLASGGYLFLSCTNGEGFDIQILQAMSDSVYNERLNYFNPKSLRVLLTECGFDIIELTTPGKLDIEIVRNKVIDQKFDISSQLFLKQIILDKWDEVGVQFQEFLAKNKLSSYMWVIAQKKSLNG